MFQSTHPRRVRLGVIVTFFSWWMFQSTHPRRVRRCSRSPWQAGGCFNPRTHEGCDVVSALPDLICAVSIHAPTKGATEHYHLQRWEQPVSIHAPTKGATKPLLSISLIIKVSIHAPTKGATKKEAAMKITVKFQSTHPRRVRQVSCIIQYRRCRSFNPRTHEGCDSVTNEELDAIEVSIHAPTKGATPSIFA